MAQDPMVNLEWRQYYWTILEMRTKRIWEFGIVFNEWSRVYKTAYIHSAEKKNSLTEVKLTS